jgi:hypothetical protein
VRIARQRHWEERVIAEGFEASFGRLSTPPSLAMVFPSLRSFIIVLS